LFSRWKELNENSEKKECREKIEKIDNSFLSQLYIINKVELSGHDILDSFDENKLKILNQSKSLKECLLDFDAIVNKIKIKYE